MAEETNSVRFDDLLFAEDRPVLTLQDVFEIMCSYGGVHDGDYESIINSIPITGVAAGEFTPASGGWYYSGTYLQGTYIGSGGWSNQFDVAWFNDSVPTNAVVKIAAQSNYGGIAFRGSGTTSYAVVWHLTAGIKFYKIQGTLATLLNVVDCPMTFNGRVLRIGIREQTYSTYETDTWINMSVWVEDQFVAQHSANIADDTLGTNFGLLAITGQTCRYGRIHIQNMTEIIPFATLDPDEVPWGGIDRAVADKVIKAFVRYDGAMRAWRPIPSSVEMVFGEAGLAEFDVERDIRQVISHVRLYYALSWVEAFNETLYETYGHRFREITSQIIEVADEAVTEAEAIIRRSVEQSKLCTFNTYACGPFLEPEDRVTMPDGEDYIIDGYSQSIDEGRIETSLQGRKYAFES